MESETDTDLLLRELLTGIGHKLQLEREKSLMKLESLLEKSTGQQSQWDSFRDAVLRMTTSESWEHRVGGLSAARVLLMHAKDEAFSEQVLEACNLALEDEEVRVRLAVGSVLRLLAEQGGTEVYVKMKERVLTSIRAHFDRDSLQQGAADASIASSNASAAPEPADDSANFLSDLLRSSYTVEQPGTGEMRHGTEGWRCLETSFRALQNLIDGCGDDFQPLLAPELLQLIFSSLHHANRFVRETGYFVLATICRLSAGPGLEAIGPQVAERLRDGLSENWSQVRFAACVAVRAFLLAAGNSRERFFPQVLPPLCLNRYYVAEGVRAYTQDTWRMVMGTDGRAAVAHHIGPVVEYYQLQCRTNNFMLREAACTCMAELMAKVEPSALLPHLPALLRAIRSCGRDDTWPVRDAACLAAGRAVRAFPAECRPVLPDFYALWWAHLDDNVFSVREDAAVALGDAVRAYGREALDDVIMPRLRELLPRAREQPAESSNTGEAPASSGAAASQPAGGGAGGWVRRSMADVDVGAADGLFAGGSLVRPRRGATSLDYSCGCMDYGVTRPKQPWEASDGAAYLVRELAEAAPKTMAELLPALADLAGLDHFPQCRSLQETIWKQLPPIAKALGKGFKMYVELFLEPLFVSLACGHQLCEVAAGRALAAVRDQLGPRIFAGRLTPQQLAAMQSSPNVPPPSGALAGVVGSRRPLAETQAPQALLTGSRLDVRQPGGYLLHT